MGLFSDIPEEAKRGRKGMSGSKQLEQGHHQRAPQADDRGRDSPRTGWSNSVHKDRCFEGISSDTSYARSLSLDNVQLTSGTASVLTDAFWGQNEPRRVSATDDAILEQCPGVIGIHDDMVIFGVDQEDHDANLINLLNICQKEGLVLNSKKLAL